MMTCPIMEAAKILEPSISLSCMPSSSIGLMHQVWAASWMLMYLKVFSGTRVTSSNVVVMPA